MGVRIRDLSAAVVLGWAGSAIVHAQAAAEYGAKSAGGALSGQGPTSVAGCPIDSSLLPCLWRAYPRSMAVVLLFCVILLVRFWRKRPA